jgi:hypothetical protein
MTEVIFLPVLSIYQWKTVNNTLSVGCTLFGKGKPYQHDYRHQSEKGVDPGMKRAFFSSSTCFIVHEIR